MGWVQEQKKSNSSVTTSVTVTLDNTPTDGRLLIAAVAANANNTVTIPGWTSITQSGTSRSALLYKIASSDAAAVTASCTSASIMEMTVFEYSGNDTPTVSDFDLVIVSVSGTTAVFPAVTPVGAGELVIATFTFSNTFSAPNWASEAFTPEGTFGRSTVGSFINSGTGNVGTTLTWTSSRTGTGRIAIFKAAADGATPNSGFLPFFR